jgi:phosphoribosylanthranilate isomerase
VAVEVKICGLTNPEDAAVAVAAGVSYFGVIFAGGPRHVSVAVARGVVAASAGRPVFGVFGSTTRDAILRTRDRSGITGAQLHGAHTVELAAQLRDGGMRVWRVMRLASEADLGRLNEAMAESDAVLIEPRVAVALGGTGTPLDLDLASRARNRLGTHRVVLAGGLTPETVAQAIERVRPDVVDVSSGVEREPGRKDPARVIRFLEAVREHHSPS